MNHDVLTIGVPVLAVFLAALLNRSDVHRLEDRMNKRFDIVDQRFAAVDQRFDSIHRYFREFHNMLGEHRARIDRLENL